MTTTRGAPVPPNPGVATGTPRTQPTPATETVMRPGGYAVDRGRYPPPHPASLFSLSDQK
jgi:hypothetical protein